MRDTTALQTGTMEEVFPEILPPSFTPDSQRAKLPLGLPSDAWIVICKKLEFHDFLALRSTCYALNSNTRILMEFSKKWSIEKWKKWSQDNSKLDVPGSKNQESIDVIWHYCLGYRNHSKEYKTELKKIYDRIAKRNRIEINEEGWDPKLAGSINNFLNDNYYVHAEDTLLSSIQLLSRSTTAPLVPIKVIERSESHINTARGWGMVFCILGGIILLFGIFSNGYTYYIGGKILNDPMNISLVAVPAGLITLGSTLILTRRCIHDRCCPIRFFQPATRQNIIPLQLQPERLLENYSDSDSDNDDNDSAAVPLLSRENNKQNSPRK